MFIATFIHFFPARSYVMFSDEIFFATIALFFATMSPVRSPTRSGGISGELVFFFYLFG
jgi:hypothetical protein